MPFVSHFSWKNHCSHAHICQYNPKRPKIDHQTTRGSTSRFPDLTRIYINGFVHPIEERRLYYTHQANFLKNMDINLKWDFISATFLPFDSFLQIFFWIIIAANPPFFISFIHIRWAILTKQLTTDFKFSLICENSSFVKLLGEKDV